MPQKPLASRRSPNWAFMERFQVPSYDQPERNYLTRWRIVQTPWFGIYLHKLDGPDPRPTLHDHPWPFISLVLRGGYTEQRKPVTGGYDPVDRRVRWVNRLRTHEAHSIRHLLRTPTWTLLFVGRRTRVWGYWEPAETPRGEWVWTPFDQHRHNDEFQAAMAARKEMSA